MNKKTLLITGTLLMAIGVALGAFGAHALKATLTASGRLETYELAIRYLMIHAMALLVFGLLVETYPRLRLSGVFILSGIFFFSGSLLTLSLTNTPTWGAVAPVGGTAFILGWLLAAYTILKN
ncbi:MAG: DUF423 domain-containing protein [Cyclobacteriaceae bacterium]|nr:DUF423 domain-containing protein [Cyclobacteriaceae bacterium]